MSGPPFVARSVLFYRAAAFRHVKERSAHKKTKRSARSLPAALLVYEVQRPGWDSPVVKTNPCLAGCRGASGLFGRSLLQTGDSGRQPRFGSSGRVAMNDVPCAGLVQPFTGQTVFGFSQFGIARLDGFADLAALRSNRSLYGAIVDPKFLILP